MALASTFGATTVTSPSRRSASASTWMPSERTPSSLVTRMRGMGFISISGERLLPAPATATTPRTERRPAHAGNVFCEGIRAGASEAVLRSLAAGAFVRLVLLLPERDCGIDGSCAPRGAEAGNQRDDGKDTRDSQQHDRIEGADPIELRRDDAPEQRGSHGT